MGPRSTSRSTDERGRPAAARGHRRTSESSTTEGRTDTDALVVGQIRGPHGVRGEVRVDPRTDVSDRFRAGAVLECDGVGMLTVASVRGDAAAPIVRFAGYGSRETVAKLRDRFLRVPRAESRRATKGAYLWADLVGLRVETPEGAGLGIVRDVLRAGENDVLVVVDDAGRERLLPTLESVVRGVDVEGGRLVALPQEEAE